MRLSDFTAQLGAQLNCSFVFQTTGHQDYTRVFILRSDSCTIARATIYKGVLSHINWYKDKLNFVPFDESDVIKTRLRVWIATGTILSLTDVSNLENAANKIASDRKQEVLANRAMLPSKSRARVTGFDPRRVLTKLTDELIRRHING